MAKCAAAKALFLGYLGSVAAAAHMAAAPRAFAELKKAMEARLEVIAAPLERLYEEERLGARLGALGEATLGAKVALDDDGLLPMPKYIHGYPPSSTSYETHLLRLIVMASVALDNLFVRKLRSALEALGDPTKTVVADREVRIHGSGGALLLTITRAPVKSRARMLNKLESAEDHRDKPLPRPKFNVDTVRAGIVVEDAGMMAAVLEAIGARVGRLLRSKNAFREDAEVSYGYRAFLGNLQLESGLTVGEVFGGEQRAKWEALAEAGRAADGRELVILYDIMSYNNRGSNKQLATFAVFELEFSSRAMIEAAKTWPMHPWPTLASSLMRCHALGCREWQPPCHRCAHAPSRWQCFGRRVTNRRARELLEQESITGHIHRPTLSHLDSDSHCVCVRVCEVSVCFICL